MLLAVPPRLHSRIRKPSTLTPPRRRIHPPAAPYCYRPWTYPPKQRIWSAATTPGQARMNTSAQRKAFPHLCLECLRSQVDPKFGSLYITTALNLSSYTPDKPRAPLRSSPSTTHHRPRLPPARTEGPLLRQPYCHQNPAIRREEMAQVQQMLSCGIIHPFNSPWASPVVMAKKKDGSLRFCVDFRQLNAATIKDAHPIPRIDNLPDALHGARWFTTLDLKSGYWQVPIQEQDKEKTAFHTSSSQLCEFNQVPFGLCNAPATFSRLMGRVLAGLH